MTRLDCLRPGGLKLTDRMLAMAALPVCDAVLDVGCGAGATVAHLVDEHAIRATGLDASGDQVRQGREARPDLDFVAGRAEALPFADAFFDGVLCECVLSTVDDAVAALCEMGRVLRPGGAVMLSDLYVAAGREATLDGGIASLGRRETVERLLVAAGLAVEVWEDQSEALGRYLWDLAGSGAPPSTATARRRAGSASDQRLGYFICVARPSGRAEKGAS